MSWDDKYTYMQFMDMLSATGALMEAQVSVGARGILLRDFPNPHQTKSGLSSTLGSLQRAFQRTVSLLAEAEGWTPEQKKELWKSVPVSLDGVWEEIQTSRTKLPMDKDRPVTADDRTYVVHSFLDDFENRIKCTPPDTEDLRTHHEP